MPSFNHTTLMGNLTRTPESRTVGDKDVLITDIGLAVNDRVKRAGEWVEEVTFVTVTFFGRNAEVARDYLSKGSPVLINGRLKLDQWENKEGQKRSKLKVIGDRLVLIGARNAVDVEEPAEVVSETDSAGC